MDLRFPQLSPDGHYLAYGSDESGRKEVYVTSFPSGEGKWQVSVNGGARPRWTRDGKELIFLQQNSVMAVPVKPQPTLEFGTPQKLFELTSPVEAANGFDVSADGKRFVVVVDTEVNRTEKGGVTIVQNWFAEFKDKQKK